MRSLLVACYAVLAIGCIAPPGHVKHDEYAAMHPLDDGVLTESDLVREGQILIAAYIEACPEPDRHALRTVIDQFARRCVRVEAVAEFGQNGFRGELGSGVLLGDGGRVLTAAHVIPAQGDVPLNVVLADGRSYRAKRIASGLRIKGRDGGDWAVLEMQGFESGLEPLESARPRGGQLAVLLGYPRGGVGLTPGGEVVQGPFYRERPLAPVISLLRVEDASEPYFVPEAGHIPIPGMSGGPIFDIGGHLVSLFSANLTAVDDSGVEYLVRGAPLSGVPDFAR